MHLVSENGRRCKLKRGMIIGLYRLRKVPDNSPVSEYLLTTSGGRYRIFEDGEEQREGIWAMLVIDRRGRVCRFSLDEDRSHDFIPYPRFAANLDRHMAEGWLFGFVQCLACTHGLKLNYAVPVVPGRVVAYEFV